MFCPDGKHKEVRLRGLLACHLLKLLFNCYQRRDDLQQIQDSRSVGLTNG
jgi:hypothetical protein